MPREPRHCLHCGVDTYAPNVDIPGRCVPFGECVLTADAAKALCKEIRYDMKTGIRLDDARNSPALDPLVKLAAEAHVPDYLVSRATAIYEVVRDEQDRAKAILTIAGLLKSLTPQSVDERMKELARKATEIEHASNMLAERAARERQAEFEVAIRNELDKKAQSRHLADRELRVIRELTRAGALSHEDAMKAIFKKARAAK